MRSTYSYLGAILFVCFLAVEQTPGQENLDDMSTEERVERLERLLESQGLVDIMVRLDSLQQEIQQLRGQSEVQSHAIEELKKRQRELYIDIDRRLLQFERNGTAAAAGKAAKPETPPADAPTITTKAVKPVVTPQAAPDISRQKVPEAKPSTPEIPEQQAYQQAFDLLRELQYDKASAAFRRFLQDYPDGRYAHIALYWLGEANYAQRKFKQAITDYEMLISSYPDSPKVAEAMLKIGYSHNELENYKAARDILEKLMAKYPGTTEAGQARNLLQKIRAKLDRG